MDVFDAPMALLGFLGLVAIAPPWFFFINSYSGLSSLGPASTLLVNMLFPALVLIYLASWLEGGASV